ncbi:MAG: hypothetical protein ACRD1V_13135 [Vicinamibacterales bacterium]
MAERESGHVESAGEIVDKLRRLGLNPVLVGGMALAILGSRRITRDFDFLIDAPGDRLSSVLDVFYDRGFELVCHLDDADNVTATIDNSRVAAIRLRADEPASAYFFNPGTRLRMDLLFDFPVPAREVAGAATPMKVLGHVFDVASPEDLLRLKKIAKAARSFAGDAQDIEFLESRLKGA